MTCVLNSGLGVGTNVTDNNLQPPCRQRQQARSLGICSMRDKPWYATNLCLIYKYFNRMQCVRARSITLLNAHARSSGKTRVLLNTCYTSHGG